MEKRRIYDEYFSLFNGDKFTDRVFQEADFYCHLFPYLPKDKTAVILDLGCGHGMHLSLLKKNHFTNVFGIDVSQDQIAHAQEKGLKNVACIDSLEFLQDKENVYDVVLVMDVLEHVETDYAFSLLKAICRSLKKSGKVVIQVPNSLAPFTPLRYADITHLRCYTTESMSQSLRYGGFFSWCFYPLYPAVHGIKSSLRYGLWRLFFQPFCKALFYCLYGTPMGNIYTANFMAIAKKSEA